MYSSSVGQQALLLYVSCSALLVAPVPTLLRGPKPALLLGKSRNENRGYLRDMMVKTFGSLYNEFLPTKIRNAQENGVREAHEVPTRQGTRPTGGGSSLMEALCPFRTTSFFLKFLNNPKLIKIAIRVVLESVYLPYQVPMPFRSLERSGKCILCIPQGLRFQ